MGKIYTEKRVHRALAVPRIACWRYCNLQGTVDLVFG